MVVFTAASFFSRYGCISLPWCCSTQRPALSSEAFHLGCHTDWFSSHSPDPARLLSSSYCRCGSEPRCNFPFLPFLQVLGILGGFLVAQIAQCPVSHPLTHLPHSSFWIGGIFVWVYPFWEGLRPDSSQGEPELTSRNMCGIKLTHLPGITHSVLCCSLSVPLPKSTAASILLGSRPVLRKVGHCCLSPLEVSI